MLLISKMINTIYMKKICFFFSCLFITSFSYAQKEEGWTNLFDEKTLNGWKRIVGSGKYSVVNNTIVGTTVAQSPNTFLITKKKYFCKLNKTLFPF